MFEPIAYNLGAILRYPHFAGLARGAGSEIDSIPGYTCAVQATDGSLLLGCPLRPHEAPELPSLGAIAALQQEIAAAMPALADVPFVTTWAGRIPTTPDNLPLVGPTPQVDGLVVATGLSFGNTAGPAIGELVGRIAAQEELPAYAGDFEPERFLS